MPPAGAPSLSVASVLPLPVTLINPPPVAVKALPVVVRTSRLPLVKKIDAPALLVSVTPAFVVVVSETAGPENVIVPELQLLTRIPLLPLFAVIFPVWKVNVPQAAAPPLLMLT